MKIPRKTKKKWIFVHHIFVFALISLVFISQIAVKAWIIENCLKQINYDRVNENLMDFVDFIDFLS